MNIKITYNWLLDYLETDATPLEMQKYLSLCGPSVESVAKVGDDFVFDIEITSNRIDTASVIGVAQEAQAILPMFGKKAVLKSNPLTNLKFGQIKTGSGLELKVEIEDPDLVSRFTALIFDKIKLSDSPDFIKKRLAAVGVKVINNVVDISNYLMITLGQPIHMFDYDKIDGHKMIVRNSKKGEKLVTLDEKEITLPGGDVVIEDGSGRLIDLCGIMGGLNSAILPTTKRVLLFVQTYNKSKIRKTTMTTGQRTIAATFFEKGLDEERVEATTVAASQLLEKYCQGILVSKIKDIFPQSYVGKVIKIKLSKFEKLIGVRIPEKKIIEILKNLGFEVKMKEESLLVTVPSSRKFDVLIEEDLIEEVARIFGYQNVPSVLQPIVYIDQPKVMEDIFVFQNRIKMFLKHLGLNEVINYSMVSEDQLTNFGLNPKDHLKLTDTISKDIEYLRTNLSISLLKNIQDNRGKKETLRLFEIGKVYIKDGPFISTDDLMIDKVRPYVSLPNELYKIGVATNTGYFDLKGIVEALFRELNADFVMPEIKEVDGAFLTEIDFKKLVNASQPIPKYKNINSFAVIKLDKTFELSANTTYEVVRQKAFKSKLLQKLEVVSLFKNKLTLRFYYSSVERNITEEVAKNELDNLVK